MLFGSFIDISPVILGTFGSLMAGLASGLGALPIYAMRRISDETQDVLLGFAAGVMLGASFFSLMIPGLEAARLQGAGEIGAVTIVGCGVLLGAAGLWAVHCYTPHEP